MNKNPSIDQMRYELMSKGGKAREKNLHRLIGQNHPDVPKTLYHGTNFNYEDGDKKGDTFHAFKLAKGLGHHVGTIEQATNINIMDRGWNNERTKKNAHIMPVHIQAKNPLRASDVDVNTPWKIIQNLEKEGRITPEHLEALREEGNKNQNWKDLVIRTIKGLGHDSLVYQNAIEGKGDSYVLFDPNQIKSAIGNNGNYDINEEEMNKAKGGIISMLRKHGRPVDSDLDAMRKMSNGHRVFIAHEQDDMPREIHSVSEMHGYTPDQIYTIDPKHLSRGNKVTHAHHLEIEERPL